LERRREASAMPKGGGGGAASSLARTSEAYPFRRAARDTSPVNGGGKFRRRSLLLRRQLSGARSMDRVPNFVWRRRHVDMLDAQRTERIENGADDGRRRACRTGFAGAFDAERIGRRWHLRDFRQQVGEIRSARHRVVLEAAGDQLAIGIEHDRFHQRLADALRDAAMDLAIAEQFVDDLADIVDGGVTRERDQAGLRIDLDFAKVAAIGKVSMARRRTCLRPRARLRIAAAGTSAGAATAPPPSAAARGRC